MVAEFFELKYRILEIFYDNIFKESYTFSQAAGKTYYEFHQEINDYGIEMVVIYITMGLRLIKHNSIADIDRFCLSI